MEKKIIFVDIDGTLCDDYGKVPPSAKKAIALTRNKGNLVYLCTGRSKPEIEIEELADITVDGVIAAGGCYVESDGEIITQLFLDENSVKHALDFFNKNKLGYYIESDSGLFPGANFYEVLEQVVAQKFPTNSQEYQNALEELDWFRIVLDKYKNTANLSPANKITFISSTLSYDEIFDVFGEDFSMNRATFSKFGNSSGELLLKGVSKGTGIGQVLTHLSLSKDQSFGYGDSFNDMEMFRAVGHSVAMANAQPALKELADEQTDTPANNGIYNSFVKNGLI